MRIAIDGYSACGKSTLARGLARSLGFLYIDTGAMYRAVTLHLLRAEVPLNDPGRVEDAIASLQIDFEQQAAGTYRTLLDREDIEKAIRSMKVSENVSAVAALTVVRKRLVRQQRFLAREGGAVLDGRDIGTVVFPDARLKIFLTADFDTRVQRRFLELRDRGEPADIEQVRQNLRQRDYTDTHRSDSPLKQAADAVVVDNTNLRPNEQLAMCLALARERLKDEAPEAERP